MKLWCPSIWVGGLIAVALPLASLSAQVESGKTDGAKPAHQRKSIDERLGLMKENLSLTDEQVAKLKTIFEEQKAKLDPIWTDASLSADQKREKSKPIVAETRVKIAGVLTPEQKAKLEQNRKEKREKKTP